MNLIDLGRRAVACEGWRWLPGMLTHLAAHPDEHDENADPGRVVDKRRVSLSAGPALAWGSDGVWYCTHPRIPDLFDPCTLGGLLALVREAYNDPHLTTAYNAEIGLWFLVHHDGERLEGMPASGDTEAEVLVAALEAAAGGDER